MFLHIVGLVLIGLITFKIYMKLTTGWCRSQTCLIGKTVIVTGANTGIGFEAALDFAKRGARVILACRNRHKAVEACSKIVKKTDNNNIVVRLVDMSSLESVRGFAKNINETEERLDVLVNNAGAGGIGDKRTKDGNIFIMQVNYFSGFLLTHLLLDLMKKTGQSRIVNVSSLAGKYARDFKVETIDQFPGRFQVYQHSKLCQILFTKELAHKLEGTGITTYSLHPGAVKTEIFRHTTGGFKLLLWALANVFFKTSEEGAQTTLYCALEKGLEDYNGEHFADCKLVTPYKTAQVEGLSKQVWETSETIVHLKPEEKI